MRNEEKYSKLHEGKIVPIYRDLDQRKFEGYAKLISCDGKIITFVPDQDNHGEDTNYMIHGHQRWLVEFVGFEELMEFTLTKEQRRQQSFQIGFRTHRKVIIEIGYWRSIYRDLESTDTSRAVRNDLGIDNYLF